MRTQSANNNNVEAFSCSAPPLSMVCGISLKGQYENMHTVEFNTCAFMTLVFSEFLTQSRPVEQCVSKDWTESRLQLHLTHRWSLDRTSLIRLSSDYFISADEQIDCYYQPPAYAF